MIKIIIMVIIIYPSAFIPLNATQILKEENYSIQKVNNDICADSKVTISLFLCKHPATHLISLQANELSILAQLENESEEHKLLEALKYLHCAITEKSNLHIYEISQVYSYAGNTYVLLGEELKRLYKQSNYKQEDLNIKAKQYFENSIETYAQAIDSADQESKYYIARDLVQGIIVSGDLYKALEFIDKFENKQIKPNAPGSYLLLKLKADIYYLMGKATDSGLAYEEWISKGSVDPYISPSGPLLKQLILLKRATGHPNNLPREYDNEPNSGVKP